MRAGSNPRLALEEARRKGFEPRDVPPRGVVYAALGLFAGIAVSAGFVAGLIALLPSLREPASPTSIEAARQGPPEPRLEISPPTDRMAVEAAARSRLDGYGWTDRAAGRAHIPIDRAMDILARRGWPDDDAGRAPP